MTDETQSETAETDQYDPVLRAMEEGLLISLNNEVENQSPTGELRVKWSRDDETHVVASGFGDRDYQIHRDRRGELVYSEITEDGVSYEDEVVTIEVLGIDD